MGGVGGCCQKREARQGAPREMRGAGSTGAQGGRWGRGPALDLGGCGWSQGEEVGKGSRGLAASCMGHHPPFVACRGVVCVCWGGGAGLCAAGVVCWFGFCVYRGEAMNG